jgi:alkaline phosphatase
MKIGLFADAHYSSQALTCGTRRNSLSLEKLKAAYAFFAKQGCGLCVSLGDLIDKNGSHDEDVKRLKEVRDVIVSSGIETVCLMGNHDAFTFGREEYYRILGGCEPVGRTADGRRLIFADACYFGNGERYTPAGGDWKDCFVPDEEAFLASLGESETPAAMFLHHNIDPALPEKYRPKNADALFRGINESGRVRAVFQGHYHPGARGLRGRPLRDAARRV